MGVYDSRDSHNLNCLRRSEGVLRLRIENGRPGGPTEYRFSIGYEEVSLRSFAIVPVVCQQENSGSLIAFFGEAARKLETGKQIAP